MSACKESCIARRRWCKDEVRDFKYMRNIFDQCYEYHSSQSIKWKRVFNIITGLSITLSFTAICIELIIEDSDIVRYCSFSEKVITMCLLVYLFTVNPGYRAYKHDKCSTDYLTMSTDILVEGKRDNHINPDVLISNLYTKYKNVIDRSKHSNEIKNPFDNGILTMIDIQSAPC